MIFPHFLDITSGQMNLLSVGEMFTEDILRDAASVESSCGHE